MPHLSKKILIIEDDQPIRELLSEFFSLEGFSVETAKNGQEGLDKLAMEGPLPSMILLDIMMPIMDGLTFYEHKKVNKRFSKIPVVMMTANTRLIKQDVKKDSIKVLSKPIDLDILSRTIADVV